MAEMTLSDYKDKIVVGIGACVIAWLSFLTPWVLRAPMHEEVLHKSDMELINNRLEQCLSFNESARQRLYDLEQISINIRLDLEKIKSNLDIKNKKSRKEYKDFPLDFL